MDADAKSELNLHSDNSDEMSWQLSKCRASGKGEVVGWVGQSATLLSTPCAVPFVGMYDVPSGGT